MDKKLTDEQVSDLLQKSLTDKIQVAIKELIEQGATGRQSTDAWAECVGWWTAGIVVTHCKPAGRLPIMLNMLKRSADVAFLALPIRAETVDAKIKEMIKNGETIQ